MRSSPSSGVARELSATVAAMADLTVVAVPGYFGSMVAEHRALTRRPYRSAADYEKQDTRTSLLMGTVSLVLPALTARLVRGNAKRLAGIAVAAGVVTTLADRRDHDVRRVSGPVAVAAGWMATSGLLASRYSAKRQWRPDRDRGSGPLALALAVLGWDFIYYWNHRVMHEVRGQWAFHVVHHSSERYNLSTALRQPVAESVGIFIPYGLLARAGFRPSLIEQARGINLLYQYWIHTDVIRSIGRAESTLNSPSHHRVHHGSNKRYLDRNHGSILILWDRLFGTFQREEPDEAVVYGLTRNIETHNPISVIGHEYADVLRDVSRATTWRDRLSYVLRGPGWSYANRA